MAAETGAGVRAARTLDGGILFRRWLGCWIDFIAAAGLAVLSIIPIAVLGPVTDSKAILAVLFALVAIVAYFTVTEGLSGRSLGKLITGTIVVNAAGDPPGLGRALVRTLFRLVEANPFLLGGIPAGLVAALTPNHQRLGDLAAGTYVVPVKKLASVPRNPGIVGVFD
ncbi:MAG TPA: RDD family protein [Phenylobacterium sp.]|nr:RDD family protein [Phenylobacterium sp.]